MKTNRLKFLLYSLAASMLFFSLNNVAVAKGHEQMLEVGKKGAVTLGADTQVGDQILAAGRYRVRHRTEGEEHFVKFTQLDGRRRTETDVKCRVEPEPRKIRRTAFYIQTQGGMRQMTKIAVRGETASHWLVPTSH